jgi:two-component system response regulator PilR (NtrC family)
MDGCPQGGEIVLAETVSTGDRIRHCGLAVEAMKQGAYDYLTKPFQVDGSAHHPQCLEKRRCRPRTCCQAQMASQSSFAQCRAKRSHAKVFDVVRKVADSKTTSICGESGTGKNWLPRDPLQ